MDRREDRAVTVSFLDVGQGDATLVVDHASGRAVLIDCPSGSEDVVEAALERFGAVLEIAVITHFDDDHSGGVIALLGGGVCGRLVSNVNAGYRTATDEAQHRRIVALKRRGLLDLSIPYEGQSGSLAGSRGRVAWRVLSPTALTSYEAYTFKNRNRASLVLRLEVSPQGDDGPKHRLIVAGDADGPVWRRLLASGQELGCYALLWPHHGGRLGGRAGRLPRQLLAKARPELVVVSTGSSNGNGHPAQTTLDALRRSPVRLACTQVTRRCHPVAGREKDSPCSGSVELRIGVDGSVDVYPSPERHLEIISQWDQPQCIETADPVRPPP